MQNIKMLAYNFLLEAQFKELNVSLGELKRALKTKKIYLLSYFEAKSAGQIFPDNVWKSIVKEMEYNNGISVICNQITYIIYSDKLCYGKKIHTIYHELGHIKAEHKRSGDYGFEENEEQEREAEAFAYYVTAPPCILHEIGGISDYVLARLTGLDINSAKVAYQLLDNDRQDRLVAIEKRLILQYDGYIKANKDSEFVENTELNKVTKKRKNLIFVAFAAALVVICVIFGLSIHNSNKQLPNSSDIAANPTPISAPVTNQIVWKSKTGDVYHTDPNCYHITKTAYTMDVNDAIAAGFRKCKDCKE